MRTNWQIITFSFLVTCFGCGDKASQPGEPLTQTAEQPTESAAPAPTLPAVPNPAPNPSFGDTEALCESLCNNTEKLGCGSPTLCIEGCRQMGGVPVCPEQLHAFLACIAKEPAEHFECNEAGIPSIKDGFCDVQQKAFVECANSPN